MHTQKTASIPAAILDCPAVLEQLGRSYLTQRNPGKTWNSISATGFQQVGYLVVQTMVGREFPPLDLQDLTPLNSHRVTKINAAFVAEILLSGEPASMEQCIQFMKQLVSIMQAGSFTEEGRTAQVVDTLQRSNLCAKEWPPSLLEAVHRQYQAMRNGLEEYHPRKFPDNPVGQDLFHYRILTQLPCAAEYGERLRRLEKIILLSRHAGKSARGQNAIENHLRKLHGIKLNVDANIIKFMEDKC